MGDLDEDSRPEKDTFDVVIIGGGTAGCVLASRLSEEPSLDVVLIEAGKDKNSDPWVTTPGLYPHMLGNPDYDWQFASEPQVRFGPSLLFSRGE